MAVRGGFTKLLVEIDSYEAFGLLTCDNRNYPLSDLVEAILEISPRIPPSLLLRCTGNKIWFQTSLLRKV